MSVTSRPAPREGWILAGTLDGQLARPTLLEDICGIPHLLRLACDVAVAGATKIYILWDVARPLPDLSTVFADPRIARRATLEIVTRPPAGNDTDGILVVRADRLFHRDLPRAAIAAWQERGTIGKVSGAQHDAVFATDRSIARELAEHAADPGGLAAIVAKHGVAAAAPPYLAFTAAAADRRALRRAERTLVWSLRKSADGLVSKLVNRRLSLPLSWLLARTPVHPNHITLLALAFAIVGGSVISRGGYAAGLVGMLLVNLGSIIDGVDGELARLRFQFSRTGQWLDTVVDDLANISYAGGVILSLQAAGVSWAIPLGVAALGAFTLTQITQYVLIWFVYRSGDLAAIPWAMQSSEQLSGRGVRSFLPKLFKRDCVLTVMVVLAIAGRLDLILIGFAVGAFVFFGVFFVQFARHGASRRSSDRASPA
ncbi:MAG: CDP-alcohol phosphatidyltransferase family protein [Deltaproteobacteria bacterium]|nr:CDP-alcohol phosphatidyltransferase family protein [Deltaproteobacteria bacterium]